MGALQLCLQYVEWPYLPRFPQAQHGLVLESGQNPGQAIKVVQLAALLRHLDELLHNLGTLISMPFREDHARDPIAEVALDESNIGGNLNSYPLRLNCAIIRLM